jgi:hypothetical protein
MSLVRKSVPRSSKIVTSSRPYHTKLEKNVSLTSVPRSCKIVTSSRPYHTKLEKNVSLTLVSPKLENSLATPQREKPSATNVLPYEMRNLPDSFFNSNTKPLVSISDEWLNGLGSIPEGTIQPDNIVSDLLNSSEPDLVAFGRSLSLAPKDSIFSSKYARGVLSDLEISLRDLKNVWNSFVWANDSKILDLSRLTDFFTHLKTLRGVEYEEDGFETKCHLDSQSPDVDASMNLVIKVSEFVNTLFEITQPIRCMELARVINSLKQMSDQLDRECICHIFG